MNAFCRLLDHRRYVACSWDLAVDEDGRLYWVEFFKRHLRTILKLGMETEVARGFGHDAVSSRARSCEAELDAKFDEFVRNPEAFGRVTILRLDEWRDELLRKHLFNDAFAELKHRENAKMLPLLPKVCAQLDSMSGRAQVLAMVKGVFAGNIFDMGADATAKAFLNQSPDFFTTRDNLTPRPWLIDDFDALADRLESRRHHKAVFFIDNAGSDFLLGALPMMRWLAMRGTQVVLAANERPTLNDMTIHDVNAWWGRIIEAEPSLAQLPIQRVSSGTGEPLIDLSKVSDELNAASEDADMVILEGMGRGVESNLDAQFNCDALNVAMLKDVAVSKRVGGKVFDVVCQFRAKPE
jgi:type II pantothenate kinase